jgi:Fe-S oxidoreductase
VACPFCKVMIADGVGALQPDLDKAAQTQVMDVAQLLLRAVQRV